MKKFLVHATPLFLKAGEQVALSEAQAAHRFYQVKHLHGDVYELLVDQWFKVGEVIGFPRPLPKALAQEIIETEADLGTIPRAELADLTPAPAESEAPAPEPAPPAEPPAPAEPEQPAAEPPAPAEPEAPADIEIPPGAEGVEEVHASQIIGSDVKSVANILSLNITQTLAHLKEHYGLKLEKGADIVPGEIFQKILESQEG